LIEEKFFCRRDCSLAITKASDRALLAGQCGELKKEWAEAFERDFGGWIGLPSISHCETNYKKIRSRAWPEPSIGSR